MALTWIEVADTAVKIGLGAVISGVAAYRVAKLGHKHSISKEVISRRIAILEECCGLANEFFYQVSRFIGILDGIVRTNNCAGQPILAVQRSSVASRDAELIKHSESRTKAISKAELLKVKKASEALQLLGEEVRKFRHIVIFDQVYPTVEQAAEFEAKFRQLRSDFHAATSDYLEALQGAD